MWIASLTMADWMSYESSGPIELGPINIFVGPNNSGKSAILRAIGLLQGGMEAPGAMDVRLGSEVATVKIDLADMTKADMARHFGNLSSLSTSQLTITAKRNVPPNGGFQIDRMFTSGNSAARVREIPAAEPGNFIYPYFASRKVYALDGQIDVQRTVGVSPDLRNLPAKVRRLSNPDYEVHEIYSKLCLDVLGFRVSTYPGDSNNQKVGISVGRYKNIPIEAMGEGVPSIVGLIANLCMAERNLFLIEELENDIHPEALKKLLGVIVELSQSGNQFVITTHSNVVVKNLGSDSRLFQVELTMVPNAVPTSRITSIENTPAARIGVLRQLGYELYDSDLYDGWLILEESSAETIIHSYLIPWFVPRLARIRTVAAGGVSKAGPAFDAFRQLFLFLHLEEHYQGRAWVALDGDADGTAAVKSLRKTYSSWNEDHFRTWSRGDFEEYYPAPFAEQVDAALGLSHDEKRKPKRDLLEAVRAWCDNNENEAKVAFAESASEVIRFLQEIDRKLFDADPE